MSSKLIVDTIEDSTGTYSLALGSGNSTFPGGIHIGGTGSANLLDDYEEGTWTPVINSGTVRALDSRYTKVGRMVYLRTYLDTWSDQSSSTNIYITGLPFAPISTAEAMSFGVMIRYMTFGDGPIAYITSGGQIRVYAMNNSGNYSIRQYTHWSGSSASLRVNTVYETDA